MFFTTMPPPTWNPPIAGVPVTPGVVNSGSVAVVSYGNPRVPSFAMTAESRNGNSGLMYAGSYNLAVLLSMNLMIPNGPNLLLDPNFSQAAQGKTGGNENAPGMSKVII